MHPGSAEAGRSRTDGAIQDDFRTYRATRDREARERLVNDHLGLARALARRYTGRGVDDDDLFQIATLGLLKAIDGYDPALNTAFSTYAVPTILGEIRRHFRDRGWSIHVPRRLQELRRQADAARQSLEQRLQRPVTAAEIASELGTSADEVLLALDGIRSCFAPGSLDDDRAGELVDLEPQVENSAVSNVMARGVVDRLSERDQEIVTLRYWSGLTQQEIAEQVGISQMHVSRLLRRSLRQMRAALDGEVSEAT